MGCIIGAAGRDKILQKVENERYLLKHRCQQSKIVSFDSKVLAGSALKTKKSFFFDGRIHNFQELDKTAQTQDQALENFFKKRLKNKTTLAAIKELVSKANGAFALAFEHQDKLFAFNDFLGQKTLWYGQQDEMQAFASEPYALIEFDISLPQPLPPGQVLVCDKKRIQTKKTFDLTDFKKTVPKKTTFKQFKKSFLESIALRSQGLKKAGVFFSGGVDSSVIVAALKEQVPNVELITVGLKGSADIEKSQEVAEELGLKLHLRVLKKEEVPDYALKTLKALTFFDILQLQIGLPEFVAAETAQKKNLPVVFAGQGSDELFAGYSDFKQVLKEKGVKGVKEATWQKLENCWQRNFIRDDLMAMQHGIELRLPFLDQNFLRQALALHTKHKITGHEDALRKHAVRQLALELNVPKTAAERPKKALQYGTGLAKEIKKLVYG
jgi:asparagine synthase (glutamine-hydrolysing)